MAPMSTDVGQAIHSFEESEHHDLTAGIDRIHEIARELTSLPANEISIAIAAVLDWIERSMKPLMAWEEGWLFPLVDDRALTPWATRSFRYDHRQIERRADRLHTDQEGLVHGPTHEASIEARCDLFALEAVLRAHIEREERLLLPLLDPDAGPWSVAVAK
jgi:iron-sulfur cluster repair protein YtfE (RIC family)